MKANAAYKALRGERPARLRDRLPLRRGVLPSPYASSFGGFVNLHTSLWFGGGGILSSFVNTRREEEARAGGEGDARGHEHHLARGRRPHRRAIRSRRWGWGSPGSWPPCSPARRAARRTACPRFGPPLLVLRLVRTPASGGPTMSLGAAGLPRRHCLHAPSPACLANDPTGKPLEAGPRRGGPGRDGLARRGRTRGRRAGAAGRSRGRRGSRSSSATDARTAPTPRRSWSAFARSSLRSRSRSGTSRATPRR